MESNIRKIVFNVEKVWRDRGARLDAPVLRGWAAAVMENPFAGRYEENLVPFMETLEPLAYEMGTDLMTAMKIGPRDIESYGKGSIVGDGGEMEHAAIWHNPGGAGIRRAIEGGAAGVSGSMKVGPAGTTLDLSICNVDASNVRSHYDSLSVSLGDAPRADEVAYIVALATGGRPHPRLGTLITAEEARTKAKRP